MLKYHTSFLAKCHFYWSVSGWTVANTSPALAIVCITSVAFWRGLRRCGSKWPEQLHSQLYTQTTCTTIPVITAEMMGYEISSWDFRYNGLEIFLNFSWCRNVRPFFWVRPMGGRWIWKRKSHQSGAKGDVTKTNKQNQKESKKKKSIHTDYFIEFSIIPSLFGEGNHAVWSQVIRFPGKELSEEWSVVWLRPQTLRLRKSYLFEVLLILDFAIWNQIVTITLLKYVCKQYSKTARHRKPVKFLSRSLNEVCFPHT